MKVRQFFRDTLGTIHREVKIAVTPVVEPDKWIFLVGCYNSGTTLLSELLATHPDISALPTEGHFLTNQFVKDYEIGFPRMWAEREELFRLTEQDEGPNPHRIKKEWMIRLDSSRPVFLEKSPPNTPRTRWLQQHFAPACFIAIVRNGYAVAEGIHRKADPDNEGRQWPLELCANQWARSYEVLLEDEPFLNKLLWIRYEDLAENTLDALNNICDFAGLSRFSGFDENNDFNIHERNEPVKNLNQASISKLSDQQKAIIRKVAGKTLEKFNYSAD